MPAQENADLARFQDDFILALYGGQPQRADVAALVHQSGFKVYRNTVIKGCVDALTANYPVIARLVGDEWFHAAALEYVRAAPPVDAGLLQYGRDFPDFLAAFAPAQSLPYLSDVARLDLLWTEVHIAADEVSLDATAIANLEPDALGAAVLSPHSSARWVWFDTNPAYSIWSANRLQTDIAGELSWTSEGALLTRVDGSVRWQPISIGVVTFLDACAAGAALGNAAEEAVSAELTIDVANMLSTLITAGAFSAAVRPYQL